eukprot:11184-Heterococcus_DN1.PRE.3
MADTLQMLQHKIQFQAYDIESEDWQVSMHADTASYIHTCMQPLHMLTALLALKHAHSVVEY